MEEATVAECGEDPSLGQEHTRLRLGLIPWAATARGHDRDAVVASPLEVRPVDHRLVPARPGHAAAQVIRDDDRRAALEEVQHADVGTDPRRQILGEARLGVGVVRGAEDADEQLDRHELAGRRIAQDRPLAREVDEGLLAGTMHLAHRRGQGTDPALVVAAELAVAVAVRVGIEVLQPQTLERDARTLELLVEPCQVRQGPRDPDQIVDPLEEAGLQPGVVQFVRERPAQPGLSRPAAVLGHGPEADPTGPGHGPLRQAAGPPQSQDLADLSHQQPLRRHPGTSFVGGTLPVPRRYRCVFRMAGIGVRDSAGISVQDPPEPMFTIDRNRRSGCSGIRNWPCQVLQTSGMKPPPRASGSCRRGDIRV